MPNHVKNIITIQAEGERLEEILSAIKDDKLEIGSIDFNKIIPMPEELNIEKGSDSTKGFEMFIKYVEKTAAIKEFVNEQPLTPERLKYAQEQKESVIKSLNNMSEEDKRLFQLGKQMFDNIDKYGYSDWYEWSIANWDTKWNAYDMGFDGKNTLCFYTAWSAPENVIRTLATKYPEIGINHRWADEELGNNLGEREYKNGDIVYQHIPDSFSKEAYDIAFEIWGMAPEECGLKLSAAGTEYIEIDEEETPLLPEADEEEFEL